MVKCDTIQFEEIKKVHVKVHVNLFSLCDHLFIVFLEVEADHVDEHVRAYTASSGLIESSFSEVDLENEVQISEFGELDL